MHSRTRTAIAAAVAAAALAGLQPPAHAQAIGGRVVLAGWNERVPSARVRLLAADLTQLAQVQTDAEGRFVFPALQPGAYHVKAELGDHASPLQGPLTLTDDDPLVDVEVVLPSELYNQARACPKPEGSPISGLPLAAGVIAGIAYDEGTGTPIPGAKMVLEWTTPGGGSNHLVAPTDGAGRYVFCGVAASVPLNLRAEALGRVVGRASRIEVNAGALARLDLPVQLTGGPQLRILEATEERAGAMATLHGRLLDAESGGAIAGAAVELAGTGLGTLTGDDGSFRITGVPPGDHAFTVSRLGYDWTSGTITVGEGATMVMELRAAPSAVELEALVVRTSTPETRIARGATQAPRVMAGARLRSAEQRAASMWDVLRTLPSLKIRHGRFETADGVEYGMCIESSRALMRYAIPEQKTTLPWCEMIAVVIDGVATVRGTEAVDLFRVREVESIEFLPPLGALQYGERAAVNGALVIWTRGHGPHASSARDEHAPRRRP